MGKVYDHEEGMPILLLGRKQVDAVIASTLKAATAALLLSQFAACTDGWNGR